MGKSQSGEYYVDAGHPARSDANPGTQEKPFETIQAAVDAASGGDTVWVKPGVYRETVTVTKSGLSADRMLRIAATEPRRAIIRGSDIVEDWQLVGAGLFRCAWPHKVTPRQEHMFGFKSYPDQVFVDGMLMEHVEQRDRLDTNTFWVDRKNEYIYLKLDASESPVGKLVEVSRRERWLVTENVRFVHLQGLRMEHSTGSLQIAGCWVGGEDCLVEQSEFAWAGAGVGLGFRGPRNTVRKNEIHHNGQMGFGGGGNELLFENNFVHHNNIRPIVDWESGVGKISCTMHGVFRYNVFADTPHGPGLWFDIENYFNLVEKNTFDNVGYCSIMIEISYGMTVRNNIVMNANRTPTPYRSYSCTGILIQLSCKNKIYNNLVYNTDGYGIHLRWHVRERDIHPFEPADPEEYKKVRGFAQGDWMGPGQYPLDDNDIRNNLLVDNSHGAIHIDFHKDYVHRNTSDYNLFWDSVLKHPMDGGHRLLEWQEMTGLDQHSVYSKEMHDGPLFKGLDRLDFRPAPGSPAIGAGQPLEDVPDDFVGNPRPKNGPVDIGPFQSGA
ncbi:MAG: hypothetical protein GF418_05040 [Chitinivibrionales bacterium]|nr:hypothetical protein [Chitinivibrionales bacterium]MBD3394975.1 hypothetical protein [Chitinivibrionales bacterium]